MKRTFLFKPLFGNSPPFLQGDFRLSDFSGWRTWLTYLEKEHLYILWKLDNMRPVESTCILTTCVYWVSRKTFSKRILLVRISAHSMVPSQGLIPCCRHEYEYLVLWKEILLYCRPTVRFYLLVKKNINCNNLSRT